MKTTLVTLVLATAFALTGFTAEKPKFYGEVTAVDSKQKTITVYENPTKSVTYQITDKTRFVVNEKPGNFGEIKDGMKVSVTHKAESTEADFITAESMKKSVAHHASKNKK